MKTSTKAVSLSAFLFPGLGQFYLKQYIKGMLFTAVAAVSFMIIMSAAFSIALSIANEIETGKITLGKIDIKAISQQVMDVFQQPNLVTAKIAMIASWLISTVDAWLSGKKLSEKN
ncbi:MAG: hypothetical protein ACRBBR_15455 [Cellvibrionaceae bacterium]